MEKLFKFLDLVPSSHDFMYSSDPEYITESMAGLNQEQKKAFKDYLLAKYLSMVASLEDATAADTVADILAE